MLTKEECKDKLTKSYHNFLEGSDSDLSRASFLAESLFEYHDCDEKIARKMGLTTLGICKVISENNGPLFCSMSEIHEESYVTILNSAFVKPKIAWKDSVRTCYWNFEEIKVDNLFLEPSVLTLSEWTVLLEVLVEWVNWSSEN